MTNIEKTLEKARELYPSLGTITDKDLWNKLKNPKNVRLVFDELKGKTDEYIYEWIEKRDKSFENPLKKLGAEDVKERTDVSKLGTETYDGLRQQKNIWLSVDKLTGEQLSKKLQDISGIPDYSAEDLQKALKNPDDLSHIFGKGFIEDLPVETQKEYERLRKFLLDEKLKRQQEIDKQVFKQMGTKTERNEFWKKKSKSSDGELADKLKLVSGNFMSEATGISPFSVAEPVKEIYPVSSMVGSMTGILTSAFLWNKYLGSPTVTKMIGRNYKFFSKLPKELQMWFASSLSEGIGFGARGTVNQLMRELKKEDEFSIDNIAKEGLKEFGLGFFLNQLPFKTVRGKGIIPFAGSVAKRMGAGAGLGAGWTAIWKLSENGYIRKEDLSDIMINGAVGSLVASMGLSGNKALANAVRKSDLNPAIKKNLFTLFARGNKKLPKKAVKKLVDGVTDNKKFNPLEMPIIKEFNERMNILTEKSKVKMAQKWADEMTTNLRKFKGNIVKAQTETYKTIDDGLRKFEQYKDIIPTTKVFFKRFKEEILEGDGLIPALKRTRKSVRDWVQKNGLNVVEDQFDVLENITKIRVKKLVGDAPLNKDTLLKLMKKQKVTKFMDGLDDLLNQRLKNIDEMKKKAIVFTKKSTRIRAQEFIQRHKQIRKSFKKMIDKLDITKDEKDNIIKYADNKIENTIQKFKQYLEMVREGVESKKVGEMSGLRLLTDVETSVKLGTENFKKAYKKLSDQYYKQLDFMDNLSIPKRDSLLNSAYLGNWVQGKGIRIDSPSMNIKTMKKLLPFFDEGDIKDIKRIAKEIENFTPEEAMKKFMFGGKRTGAKGQLQLGMGWGDMYLGVDDYVFAKYGLDLVGDKLDNAVLRYSAEKSAVVKMLKEMEKTFKKLSKKAKVNVKDARLTLFNIMDKGESYIKQYKKTFGRDVPEYIIDIAKKMRMLTDEMLGRVNKVREMTGQPQITRISDYITHIIKPEIYDHLQYNALLPSSIAKVMKYIPVNKLGLRTAMHRADEVVDNVLIKDPFKLMDTMYGMDLRYIWTQKALKRLQPIKGLLNNPNFDKVDETVAKHLNEAMENLAGRRKIWDRALDNTVEQWFAPVLRKLGFKINPSRSFNEIQKNFSKLMTLGAFGLRLKPAIRNIFTQGIYMPWLMEGPVATTWAWTMQGSKEAKNVLKQVLEYQVREPIEGLTTAMTGKIFRALTFLFGKSDKLNVRIGILSAYKNGLKIHKGNVKKAIEYASKRFRDTNWSYLNHNLPRGMQSSLGKFLGKFQSWIINNLTRRLPEVFRNTFKGVDVHGNKVTKTQRRAGLRLLMSWIIMGKVGGQAWETWKQSNVTSRLGLNPILSTVQDLLDAGGLTIAGEHDRAKRLFERAKRTRYLFIPMGFSYKDFRDVVTNKKPVEHLLFYGVEDKKDEEKTFTEKQQERLRKKLSSQTSEIQSIKIRINMAEQRGQKLKAKKLKKRLRKLKRR